MQNSPAVENEPVKLSRGKIIVYFLALAFAWIFLKKLPDVFEFAGAGFYIALFLFGMIYLNFFFWTFRKPTDRFTFRTLIKQVGGVSLFLLLIHNIFTFLFPTIDILAKPINTPFGTSESLGGIIVVLAVLLILGLGFYLIESLIRK